MSFDAYSTVIWVRWLLKQEQNMIKTKIRWAYPSIQTSCLHVWPLNQLDYWDSSGSFFPFFLFQSSTARFCNLWRGVYSVGTATELKMRSSSTWNPFSVRVLSRIRGTANSFKLVAPGRRFSSTKQIGLLESFPLLCAIWFEGNC